ncbi:MAG: LVIVD repeat-containing protein [Balneolaceae bacterium]
MNSVLKVFSVLFLPLLFAGTLQAQDNISIKIEPSELRLQVGDEIQIQGKVYSEDGSVVSDSLIFFSRARRSVAVTREGLLQAIQPGNYTIVAAWMDENNNRVMESFDVEVIYPPLKSIAFLNVPEKMYANTFIEIKTEVKDEAGLTRENVDLSYSVNNNKARLGDFGLFEVLEPGKITLIAEAEGIKAQKNIEIVSNPVSRIEIGNSETKIRTGDVVRVDAKALDNRNREVRDIPISYSFTARPDDDLGNAAPAQMAEDGRFVANVPGLYTLIAKSGNQIARQNIRVEPRNVQRRLEVVGHGEVLDVHTSDLWVWEGVDGRDYAITGTWGAHGAAYFWDVTDPSNIIPIDTVVVDARTVNDVKISEDGKLAVITREGASSRRNGIVILDVTNPRDVQIISEYDEGLTGGVHNVFIYDDHVYAVNNGRRYDIINIEDPANPYTVSKFELDTPGRAIHDVWIEHGIAYSSNWQDGIVVVDVGSDREANTPEGHQFGVGSPENPVKLGQYAYPSGWNHAAFPFKSESTGDFYVIAGDEAFPRGLPTRTNPVKPAGWIHFIKFDGWENPKEVARYEVPEAGTHNMWVKGDTLYVAYYNAGLRIVDISGELMGNLYDQGREIAYFEPNHPDALIPNTPFSWGPQPYKGYIFVSDWNSGLWAFKLIEE